MLWREPCTAACAFDDRWREPEPSAYDDRNLAARYLICPRKYPREVYSQGEMMASLPDCDDLEDVNDAEDAAGVEEAPRLLGGEGGSGS